MMKWGLRLFFCFWLVSAPLCFLFAGMPDIPGVDQEEGLSAEEQREVDEVVTEALQDVEALDVAGIQREIWADDNRSATEQYQVLQEKRRWNNTICLGNRDSRIAVYNGDLVWLASKSLRWGSEAIFLNFMMKSRIEFIVEAILAYREELLPILEELRRHDTPLPPASVALPGISEGALETEAHYLDESSAEKSLSDRGEVSGHPTEENSNKVLKKRKKKKKPTRSWFGRLKHWLFGVDLPTDPREKIVSRLFGHLKQYHVFNPLQMRFVLYFLLNASLQNFVLSVENSLRPSKLIYYQAENDRAQRMMRAEMEQEMIQVQGNGNEQAPLLLGVHDEEGLDPVAKPFVAYVNITDPVTGEVRREPLDIDERLAPVSLKTLWTLDPIEADLFEGYNFSTSSSGTMTKAMTAQLGLPKFLYSDTVNRAITAGSMLLMPLFFERLCRASWQTYIGVEWESLLHILEEYDGTPGGELILQDKVRAFVTKGHEYRSSGKALTFWGTLKMQPRLQLELLRSIPLVGTVAYKLCRYLPSLWGG